MSHDDGDELSNLMQFLYTCPVGLVDFDGEGAIGLMNPKAMQLLQPLAAVPCLSNFFSAFERCAPDLRNLAQGFAGRRGTVCENRRVVVRDGAAMEDDALVLDCTMVKLSDARFIATLSDVSRQVAQERRLKQAEVWFSSLIDGSDGFHVLSLDASGRIDGVKDDLLDEAGLERDAVLGRGLQVLEAPDPEGAPFEVADKVARANRDGWHLDEGWHRMQGGGRRWCQRLVVVRHHDLPDAGAPGARPGYVVVLRSTERQSFDAAQLRRMLQTDHLTGACNRAHFFELAERELRQTVRRAAPLSVVALDVDHFKQVNDTHGHAVGDEVLKAITAACLRQLGPGTTFARLGGEEFAILLPDDLPGACRVAETLRGTVEALAIPTPAGDLGVTASFGCAGAAPGLRSFASLLAEADKALYAAKRGGRNRVEAGRAAAA